jgi:multiple sugar transport system ATP-binding protein
MDPTPDGRKEGSKRGVYRRLRMAKVRLEHVWKRFGKVVAVKDFNLETEDGEFVVFVGPSGCGKTTTLRMIAGLEEVSEGKIFIGERLVNDVPPKDRDIAMVFPELRPLPPHERLREHGLRAPASALPQGRD